MLSSGTPPESRSPIQKYLEQISPQDLILCQRTAKHPEDLGVDSVPDIGYLKETDLVPAVLKPVQARKLLSSQGKDATGPRSSVCSISSMESLSSNLSLEGEQHSYCEQNASVEHSEPQASGSSTADGNWVSTFVVPWERFAPGIRQACAQKKRPKHSDRLDMVRKVCEAVSLYTRLPGRAALQNIARKVVSQYPESFKDYMGDSSETAAKRFLGLIYVRNVSESHVMVFTRSGSLKAFRGTILLWV